MRYAQRVAANVTVQILGRAVMLVAGLVTLRLVTAMLGIERYGDFAIATSLAMVIGIGADLGLALFAVRELTVGTNRASLLASLLGLRLATALPIVVLAPVIASLVPDYASSVRLAAFGLALAHLMLLTHQVAATWFHVALRFDLVVASEVVGRLATLGALLAIRSRVDAETGLLAVIACMVLGNFVMLGCTLGFLRARGVRLRPRWDRSLARRALRDALPLGGLGMLALLHARADGFVLSLMRPAADVGLYAVAYKVLELLVTFAPMFAGVLLPRFVAVASGGSQGEIMPLFVKALRAALVVALPAAAFTAVHAGAIVAVIQGRPGFEPAAAPLRVLAATLPALFIGSLAAMLVVALGRQRALLLPLAFLLVLNVALNLALAPRYSYHASAWITFATEGLAALVILWGIRDVVRPRAWLRTLAHAALVLTIGAIPAWLLSRGDLGAMASRATHGWGYGVLGLGGMAWFACFLFAALATRFLRPHELLGLWKSPRVAG